MSSTKATPTTTTTNNGNANNDSGGKQLVLSDTATAATASHLPPAERPVIVFSGLTDSQFSQALALFTPPPRTKPNLWAKREYTEHLIKAAAFCEAVQYMRPQGGCFANKSVANNFDGCMIERFKTEDNDDFFFSVDEWFNDTRGEIPDALKHWDPNSYEPMPVVESGVDWCAALTTIDLAYPGFLELFSNCIDLDERISQEVGKRKHGASTAFGTHPGTRMPDPINQSASFDQFTPSRLINGGGGLFGGRM